MCELQFVPEVEVDRGETQENKEHLGQAMLVCDALPLLPFRAADWHVERASWCRVVHHSLGSVEGWTMLLLEPVLQAGHCSTPQWQRVGQVAVLVAAAVPDAVHTRGLCCSPPA